jgi:hypothetical protein
MASHITISEEITPEIPATKICKIKGEKRNKKKQKNIRIKSSYVRPL